eukprot:Lithocolla_globosa_v1_NODE_3506_length_1652_cov_8.917345.p1 type:complete len:455 gc:universal NODE_3506_length_1652_cov_8.917345:56-1420(+)
MFHIHHAIWEGDEAKLLQVLSSIPKEELTDQINTFDYAGNAPIHLATLLNRPNMVDILMQNGSYIDYKNKEGWKPLDEARSVGDRNLIECVLRHYNKKIEQVMQDKALEAHQQLSTLDDFYCELDWEFSSWIPFASRFCPSDKIKIWKTGSRIRMDSTLITFERLQWVRGNMSIYFTIDDAGVLTVAGADHDKKVYEEFQLGNEQDMHETINSQMGMPIRGDVRLPSEQIVFEREQTFLGLGDNVFESVHNHRCAVYEVKKILVTFRTRREHLLTSSSSSSSSLFEGTTNTKSASDLVAERNVEGIDRRINAYKYSATTTKPSLPAPLHHGYSFDSYFAPSPTHQDRHLGRAKKEDASTYTFGGKIWVCDDFPLSMENYVALLEILSFGHPFVEKFKDFVQLKLPDGFPMQVEMPMFYVLKARVTMAKWERKSSDPKLFELPTETYEPGRLPRY